MNSFDVVIFDDADIKKRMTAPTTKFGGGCVERVETEVEDVAGIDAVKLELKRVQRDVPISIGRPFQTQAEDVFDVFVRRLDVERSEEGLFGSQGVFKTDSGDFAGGGVDPAVIVIVDFVV